MTQSTAEIRHVVARTGFANPLTLGVLVEDADYLKVYADEELLQVGVDYTVTGIGDVNGVSVEIIGAEDINEYVGYESFTAFYDPVLQQGADLSLGGNFGRAFESALDTQNRQLQAVAGVAARGLKLPLDLDASDLPYPVDGYFISWDEDAGELRWAAVTTGTVVGTAASAALEDFATAAQGLLADSAVQPAEIADMLTSATIGATVQGYDATTTKNAATQTLTNKRVTPRSVPIASSGTPTINTDSTDIASIAALATNITSMTTNLSGTPTSDQVLIFRIKDDGSVRTISWGASFKAEGVPLPTTTVISKMLTVAFMWNGSTWGCVGSAQEA